MNKTLSAVSIIVADYDEAIQFYTQKLGFSLIADIPMQAKRWVVVAPSANATAQVVLTKACHPEQVALVGKQGAGRVWLFLGTDDFQRDYDSFRNAGVQFLEKPRFEEYGTVAVFQDLYGNKWDLIERK